MMQKLLMVLLYLLLMVNLLMMGLNITLWANLVTASSTSAILASMSSSTNVDDLIVLVQMVAKKYEGHQGQRAVTVLKNGEHYLLRKGMSSFVVENLKKKLRSSGRSSRKRRKTRRPKPRSPRRRNMIQVPPKIQLKMKVKEEKG